MNARARIGEYMGAFGAILILAVAVFGDAALISAAFSDAQETARQRAEAEE